MGARVVDEAAWRQEVLRADTPVLVEITATWLEPCRLFTRVVDAVAEEAGPRLKVLRLVVDSYSLIVRRHHITSLPTVLIFREGAEVDRLVGARGRRRLLSEIADYLP